MRIVVLGGAGDMGAEAVRDLVEYSKASEIVIADRNLQAAGKLAKSLDETDKINIYWGAGVTDSKGMAIILHTIHIFTGRVTSYSGGKVIQVKAGSEKETVRFPAPLEEIKTFHLGHPEPVTLPRYLEGVNEITLKGGLAENYLNYLAKIVSALGLTRTPFTKQMLGSILKGLLPVFPKNRRKNVSGIRVDITGMRRGVPLTLSFAAVDNMRRLTGIPLSIGTILLAENKVPRFGVFGPEADNAIDSNFFLEEVSRRGILIGEREIQ